MRYSDLFKKLCSRSPLVRSVAALAIGGAFLLGGCSTKDPAPAAQLPRYPQIALAPVPPFMQGTIYERVRFSNTDTMGIYGYSMVVNLHNTGDSTAPTFIRDYMIKQMFVHQFGSAQFEEYKDLTPDKVLTDKRVALVSVEGQLPVGVRAGQRFDVLVHALRGSYTKSLAHGVLYETDLSDDGLIDPSATGAHLLAKVDGGDVFVNPSYALSEGNSTVEGSKASLLTGTVMDGAIALHDRPIFLQLRQPQVSTARAIEDMIRHRWQDKSIAAAEDEGIVQIFVPANYGGDWKHFLGVVSHMYMNGSPEFQVAKARELVQLAHQPDAKLADISLCWEAMGEEALPFYTPLLSDHDPNIAFAAARAAAYVGDPAARNALLVFANDSSNPNQIDAVNALGGLESSPEINHMMRQLLDSDKADVRVAAYKILVNSSGEGIVTKQIGDRFYLDIVESNGRPMIYATRTGIPRIAVFGHDLALAAPLTFTAMELRFSISSNDGNDLLTLFYRDPTQSEPISTLSHNDLPEILARLGGEAPSAEEAFQFNYGDVVALAQQLVDSQRVYGTNFRGDRLPATFELEHPSLAADNWTSIPTNERSLPRPQTAGAPGSAGAAPAAAPTGVVPGQKPADVAAVGTGNKGS